MKFHEYRYGLVSKSAPAYCRESEEEWVLQKRPYYKAFPCILNSLAKISLDIKQSDLALTERCFAIRFAETREPTVCNGRLLSIFTSVVKGYFIWICQLVDEDELVCAQLRTHDLSKKVTIQDEIDYFTTNPPGSITHDRVNDFHLFTMQTMALATRIALTCHLLADDPSIITPDVLSADRDRYNSETDEAWKQRAVDRARRRGIVGWNIGADYEVCPHYRRPHFGIRHTGKGKTVPRIVPIKGAVVHRSRLTEVPTGYMLPDGTEVEHGKAVSHD